MKPRHTFLICRAAAFATLLVTAGATSVSVAAGANDAGQMQLTGDAETADIAQARIPKATIRRKLHAGEQAPAV